MSMVQRTLRFGDVTYPFFHGLDCTPEIVERILALGADRYVLVLDENVSAHAEPIVRALERRVPVVTIPLHASERGKCLDLVGIALESAVRQGMTRRSCVLAMGGGVIGNMAGLLAALAFRGVRLVHLPTTIIAAMDSVLSLKQAVNGRLGKNLIGTFHAPTAVLLDHRWLTSLPPKEVRSGLCELVKNVLAIVPEATDRILPALVPDGQLSPESLRALVDPAIDAKLRVMDQDPKERGRGLALEYGHTIGHALEIAAPGLLGHGEAVGVGMLCAADIAREITGLPEEAIARHAELLGRIGVDHSLARGVDLERVLSLVRFDNKRGYVTPRADEVPMILLEDLGRVRVSGGSELTSVPLPVIARAISRIPPLRAAA
jgi:3-dehydroquinate synthase/2-deoxy-scyllo-inosose synthase